MNSIFSMPRLRTNNSLHNNILHVHESSFCLKSELRSNQVLRVKIPRCWTRLWYLIRNVTFVKERCGVRAKERTQTVNESTKNVIDAAVPLTFRYLLWSAMEQTSLFNPSLEPKKCKKNHKYILYENQKEYAVNPCSVEIGTKCGTLSKWTRSRRRISQWFGVLY